MKEYEVNSRAVKDQLCALVRLVSRGGSRVCIGRHGFNVAVLAHPSERDALPRDRWYDWRLSDAKRRLSELVAEVENGARVQVKRHGLVAAIVVGWRDYGVIARGGKPAEGAGYFDED